MEVYIRSIDVDLCEATEMGSEELQYVEGNFTVNYLAVIGRNKIEGTRIVKNGNLDVVSIAGVKDLIEHELKEKFEEI